MKQRKIYGVLALGLGVTFLLAPVSANAKGTRAGIAARQLSQQINNDDRTREERLHYYDLRGRKYREERVVYDRNTRRILRVDLIPKHLWSK